MIDSVFVPGTTPVHHRPCVLLFTVFYSLINLSVDLAYAALDPRIRLGRERGS